MPSKKFGVTFNQQMQHTRQAKEKRPAERSYLFERCEERAMKRCVAVIAGRVV